jgi:hypothetical protein
MFNELFPEYNWLPWRFVQTPKGYWQNPRSHRKFLDWVATERNITNYEDWYKVTNKVKKQITRYLSEQDLIELGGSHILVKLYEGSCYRLLSTVYPEHEWLPWRFETTPRNFWNEPINCRSFLDWAKPKLYIKNDEDWFEIPAKVNKNFYLWC